MSGACTTPLVASQGWVVGSSSIWASAGPANKAIISTTKTAGASTLMMRLIDATSLTRNLS